MLRELPKGEKIIKDNHNREGIKIVHFTIY